VLTVRARARARARAAAAQIAGDRSGPVTVTALAARARVHKDTVAGVRGEIDDRFPGVLKSRARDRVLAAAKRVADDQSGPISVTALAAAAAADHSTVSGLRPEIRRRFPGVLQSPARERDAGPDRSAVPGRAHPSARRGPGTRPGGIELRRVLIILVKGPPV
jgi:hypothetical protein